MSTATKRIEATGDGLVKLTGDVTLGELYQEMPEIELCVEPVSASQKLGAFLAEGGTGFGSYGHGTFGGQLCRLKGTYGDVAFTYGLDKAPVYNTGYPLQRIMEGPTSDLLPDRFTSVKEMVVRVQPKAGRSLSFTAADSPALPTLDGDQDVFFVNAAWAKVLSMNGSGVVRVKRNGGDGDAAWSKRFILDALPSGHSRFMALTQPSGAKALSELHGSAAADGLFMALAVHTGVFVVASAPAAGVESLVAKAAELPLTWRVGG